MKQIQSTRRAFLAHTAQGLLALPILSSIEASGELQIQAKQPMGVIGSGWDKTSVRLNVRDFGARGDGTTKDTPAVQQALDRCTVLGGGEVLVPAGSYVTGAIVLRSNTVLRLDHGAALLGSPDLADYPITQVRWEGHWIRGFIGLISSMDAKNIGVLGAGKIVGNDEIKGRVDQVSGLRHPALIEFTNCNNVRVEDCFTSQNDMWSIHPTYCNHIFFRNLTVSSGADGIDIDSCTNVVIDRCIFATHDDCISLKSGRGEEGVSIGRPTEAVRISHCTFHDTRWACIGIGSETSGGIRNVHVDHCVCNGAGTFAIYIKSRPGRGAFIEDISVNDLDVSGAKDGFLRINILNSGKQDGSSVAGDDGIPTLRNFSFSNIRVKDLPLLVNAVDIHPKRPLDGFSLTNVTGTCSKGIMLANMHRASVRNIHVTGYTGALLSTYNVTGSGVARAAPLPATKISDPIQAPDQPYELR